MALCDFPVHTIRLYYQTNARTEACQHVDEHVRTEQVDPPTDQVTDPGLRDSKKRGRLFLLEMPGCDQLLDLDQEVCANQEVLRLLTAEPEIPEHIAGRWRHSEVHGGSTLLVPSWRGAAPATRGTVVAGVSSGYASRTREARKQLRRT